MDWHWVNFRINHLIWLLLIFSLSCQQQDRDDADQKIGGSESRGKLFIIGGGKRGPELYQRMIEVSGIDQEGYGIILPMSSIEPDSSIYYAKIPFQEFGLKNVAGFNFKAGESPKQNLLDSLANASLIYISGGDQRRFMEVVSGTTIEQAIWSAWENGALIAGTSAGAAVMSQQMITGDQKKHPEYESTFSSLQSDNLILDEGLGFLKQVIIDQHFIKRSRYNRLLTAVIEMPEKTGIGIEESTAILVDGDSAEVVGAAQVIVFENPQQSTKIKQGLLGAENLRISVYLPGGKFYLKN